MEIRRKQATRCKYWMLAQSMFWSAIAFGGQKPASCEIADKSVLSRSPAGIVQVSNLGVIEIVCRVPARTFPSKPGSSQDGLKAETTVYQISAEGKRSLVPSEVNLSGGGANDATEFVDFNVLIPLGQAERDAEIRRLLRELKASLEDQLLSDQQRRQVEERILQLKSNPQELAVLVGQYRAGRFRVECHVMDGKHAIGIGSVDVEVLYKGRSSEAMLGKR